MHLEPVLPLITFFDALRGSEQSGAAISAVISHFGAAPAIGEVHAAFDIQLTPEVFQREFPDQQFEKDSDIQNEPLYLDLFNSRIQKILGPSVRADGSTIHFKKQFDRYVCHAFWSEKSHRLILLFDEH